MGKDNIKRKKADPVAFYFVIGMLSCTLKICSIKGREISGGKLYS